MSESEIKQEAELEEWLRDTLARFQGEFGQKLEDPFLLHAIDSLLNERGLSWLRLRIDHFDSKKLLAFYKLIDEKNGRAS